VSSLRILRHVFAEGSARRHFPAATLDAIQHVIEAGEQRHAGQVCFAIEGALSFGALWRGCTARERAREVFSKLRVWDTGNNSGVLIYVLLADRAIEIVADRGVAAHVEAGAWESICERIRVKFALGDYRNGAISGVEAVNDLLARNLPAGRTGNSGNEIPDRPRVL